MPDIPVPPEAVTVAHDILWGGQMSEDLVRRALEAAAPLIAAAERARIRQLAVEHHARYDETFPAAGNMLRLGVPFATLMPRRVRARTERLTTDRFAPVRPGTSWTCPPAGKRSP